MRLSQADVRKRKRQSRAFAYGQTSRYPRQLQTNKRAHYEQNLENGYTIMKIRYSKEKAFPELKNKIYRVHTIDEKSIPLLTDNVNIQNMYFQVNQPPQDQIRPSNHNSESCNTALSIRRLQIMKLSSYDFQNQ